MKKDVTVSRNGDDRAEIEALRGITRDENGQIVLSKQQKKDRIARMEGKITDFANRTKNAKAEIKRLQDSM